MNMKQFRNILAIVVLECMAPSLALAQPVITIQPTNQFLASGTTALFSVSATGASLAYQWLFDGAAISNATSRTLLLANPQPAQWGYYSAIISNASGSITSQVAELKVFVAAPHDLSGIQAQSNGLVSLNFAGGLTASFAPYYDMYPLETSSNLLDWAPLTTLQSTNEALDTLSFLDTNAPDFNLRFYRTPTNQLATPDLPPTGTYPVGTFSILLTNTLRTNAEFMVTFWYPASLRAGILPAKYVEPTVAMDNLYYNFTSLGYGAGDFAPEVEQFFSHSQSNAPPLTNFGAFPVILYQPGADGHRRENADKTEELASWGYVVVGLDTADTDVSVYPNGSVVLGKGIGSTIETYDAAIEGRVLDMQFVLDEVTAMQTNGSRLDGLLDLNNIGVFGWSLGGATAAQLCLRDSRCKAGAAFDGWFVETNLLTEPLEVPFLCFRSDSGPDPDPSAFLPDGRPDDRLEVYDNLQSNAYWVKLDSTVHGNFADPGLIDNSATIIAAWGAPMSLQFLPTARFSQIVRAYLLSFFNKFLKGQDDHLLDRPSPSYPEVMQFLTTSTNPPVFPPEYPCAALVQGSNGNFYGSTAFGGIGENGTIFEAATNGAMSVLVSFDGANGSHPWGALTLATDGNFYGTTPYGGTNGNNGTVFQMTPAGALTTLFSFSGSNGSRPFAGLLQASDGNLYGTTVSGGADDRGTIFRITPGGVLTTLVSFNGTNGDGPYAGLMQGANATFTVQQLPAPMAPGAGQFSQCPRRARCRSSSRSIRSSAFRLRPAD
jgi:uncharacterized repeat protein (TIGR03803 family)